MFYIYVQGMFEQSKQMVFTKNYRISEKCQYYLEHRQNKLHFEKWLMSDAGVMFFDLFKVTNINHASDM